MKKKISISEKPNNERRLGKNIIKDILNSNSLKNSQIIKNKKEKRGSRIDRLSTETVASPQVIPNKWFKYINFLLLKGNAEVPELADGTVLRTVASPRGVGVRTSTSEIPLLGAQIQEEILNKNPAKTHQKPFSINPLPALLLLLSIFLLFSSLAFAIPSTMTLQGKLTSKAGDATINLEG